MITSEEALQKFREDYHNSLVVHQGTSWLGVKAQKCPGDAWMYQELIHKLKPDFIIETGTAFGGGAAFLNTVCNAVGHGQVITVEVDKDRYDNMPFIGNVKRLLGSSTDSDVIEKIKEMVGGGTALVILDSDHSYEHVSKELELYKQFVRPGFYMIVEDTHMKATHNAVTDFLEKGEDFMVDKGCEKYLFTFNPDGFLRRTQ